MFRFMPRVMDRAFARMSPERRQVVLTHCHETLSVLEHKYGPAAPHEEAEPTERLAA